MIRLAQRTQLAPPRNTRLEGTGKPIPVLLVDGDRAFSRAALRFFREHFADEVLLVGAACRTEKALGQARFLRPEVIVLDLLGPGLCGLGIILLLRRLAPDAGIVVLSKLDVPIYRAAALAAGAKKFVARGDLEADLLPAIQAAATAARQERMMKLRSARVPSSAPSTSSNFHRSVVPPSGGC